MRDDDVSALVRHALMAKRKARGWTQTDVADRLRPRVPPPLQKWTAQTNIGKFETGALQRINLMCLSEWAAVLGLRLAEILPPAPPIEEPTPLEAEGARVGARWAALSKGQRAAVLKVLDAIEKLVPDASREESSESPPDNHQATPKTNPGPRKQGRRARSA